jgi:S-adenosyl methyltransferase
MSNSGSEFATGSAEERATVRLDTTVANAARIYDYLLGGKNNYAADRNAAEAVIRCIPHAAAAARQNRRFLGRVVTYLTRDQGIRQFLDIGSGLPAGSNVHEVAQSAEEGCRVVYVDYDSVAVSHARAYLATSSRVIAVCADLRDPGKILQEAAGLLDFSEPVAVVLSAVLHFLRDGEDPYGVVAVLKDALAPGSAVGISHITADGIGTARSLAAQQVYQSASAPAVPRTLSEITRFFDGLDLVEPGVTDIGLWPAKAGEARTPLSFYGGIGRKR